VYCTRTPDSFQATRAERFKVSGKPDQYDDLDVFVREQELMNELVASSSLKTLTLDISDNDVLAAVERIANWLKETGGLYMEDRKNLNYHIPMSLKEQPVGIFDSGVGGLSVLRAMRGLMSEESAVYFADQGHVPYGPRPLQQVRDFSEAVTHFLLDQGAKLIVVACNTASAAALQHLRQTFPDVSFVGMEPAVKPAAERTQTGKVGVLATPATFQGALYASVMERFANGVQVLQHTCPGLVAQIEKGDLDGGETRAILEDALRPMLDRGIDTVVLGCTHYPFVIPLIEQVVG
jgi:glutamate racemase